MKLKFADLIWCLILPIFSTTMARLNSSLAPKFIFSFSIIFNCL